jgi:hypothetical protein
MQGSHWEQRVLSGELMSSYAGHKNKLSALTLAAFEDSGWYAANYSAADGWRRGDYGYAQGCTFATAPCLDPATAQATGGAGLGSPPHFYAGSKELGAAAPNAAVCTTDRLAVGYVPLAAPADGSQIPAQYRYFTTNIGGSPSAFDYCPAVQAYSNRACFAASENGYAGQTAFGERMGANSSCFSSTLVQSASGYAAPGAACFPARCADAATLVVKVGTAFVTCTATDQQLAVPGFVGALTCPDIALACATPAADAPIVPNASAIYLLVTPSASALPPSIGGGGGGGSGGGSSASATSSLFGTVAGVGIAVIVLFAVACGMCLRGAKPPAPPVLVAAPTAPPPLPYAAGLQPQLPHQLQPHQLQPQRYQPDRRGSSYGVGTGDPDGVGRLAFDPRAAR